MTDTEQEQHSIPIFTEEWGADEELLLITGLIQNGLGNWTEAAEHVGTRTKEDCERHYLQVYLGTDLDGNSLPSGGGEIFMEIEEVHKDERGSVQSVTKKRRREFMPVSTSQWLRLTGSRCMNNSTLIRTTSKPGRRLVSRKCADLMVRRCLFQH